LYGLSEDEMKIVGAEMGDITVAPTRAQNMAWIIIICRDWNIGDKMHTFLHLKQ